MPFSKTYAQLLSSLPSELQDNAIKYHELKGLIEQLANELFSLGLSPTLLEELVNPPNCKVRAVEGQVKDGLVFCPGSDEEKSAQMRPTAPEEWFKTSCFPKVVYELTGTSNRIVPQLRLWINVPERGSMVSGITSDSFRHGILGSLQQMDVDSSRSLKEIANECDVPINSDGRIQEIILPLIYDTEFFNKLSTALESISTHLKMLNSNFLTTLDDLSRMVSNCALPTSATTSSFHPHSRLTSHPGLICVPTWDSHKSDLNSWREIFRLYLEAEVFESVGEVKHGERTVDESEKRLNLFTQKIFQLRDHRKFKLQETQQALGTFLGLNIFILNIKKLLHANTEATRNLLKKRANRTALPPPELCTECSSQCLVQFTEQSYDIAANTPRMLVQAIGETLLPILPHLDDYTCLICTSIAFKPIRLNCGHLFCVRCLVKMQKRNQGNCPMCRAACVLSANQSNVDWALLNFIQDWFPMEAREKLKANEEEAAQEQQKEWEQRCLLM